MKRIVLLTSLFVATLFSMSLCSFKAKTTAEIAAEKAAIEAKTFVQGRVYTPLIYHVKKEQGGELIKSWLYKRNIYLWWHYTGGWSQMNNPYYYYRDDDLWQECPMTLGGVYCGVKCLPLDDEGERPDLSTMIEARFPYPY